MGQKNRIAALLLVLLLAACGGGFDEVESSRPQDPNAPERVGSGSLTIDEPTAESTYSTEEDSVFLSGSAFISPTHLRCCSGSATDTGVTVTSSTGSDVSQSASYCNPLGFGPLSLCGHTWSTRITNLRVGDTRITLTARDPSGNIGRDSITIRRLPDTRAPSVVSTSPSSGASNVPVNGAIRVTFSEPMDGASITAASFRLTDSTGNNVVGTFSHGFRDALFQPASALAPFTLYTATITTGARDPAGNPLLAPRTWMFTTGGIPDTTPPAVASTSPPAGSSCAGSDAVISAIFSESINTSSVTSSTFNVVDVATNAAVSGSVSTLSPTSFAFTPSAGLAFSKQYRATLTNGIRDLAGNAMLGNHAWNFSTIPAGVGAWQRTASIAILQARQSHSAVWTGMEMIVWGGFQSGPGAPNLDDGARYRPGSDSWVAMNRTGAPIGRHGHVAVWTGSEMIVWGGGTLFDGGRYDPITDTWRPMASTHLVGGGSLKAVWTGSEMLVVGGGGMGRYDPASDTWSAMSAPPLQLAHFDHSLVWTGSRMIVWGGSRSGVLGVGVAYDPAANAWEPVNPNGSPAPRRAHSGVWTGSEMIIWGGQGAAGAALNDGGIYNPQTATWRPMSTCGASAKNNHSTVWTGGEMMVWGGSRNTGQRYDVATDSWRQLQVLNSPTGVSGHSSVWTGTEMVIWGGGSFGSREGARYQP